MSAAYEAWADRTGTVRETAAHAKAEIGRRSDTQPAEKPPTMAGWWRQFQTDLSTMDRAIDREHQAAIAAGQPWPPQHTAQAPAARAEAAAIITRPQHDGYLRESGPDPEVPSPGPAAPGSEPPAALREADDRSVRLDDLQARADRAAQGIAAENVGREARMQYAARLERQAHVQAEPAAERQAEVTDGFEMEL